MPDTTRCASSPLRTSRGGSYQPGDRHGDLADELARLEVQALLSWEQERCLLLDAGLQDGCHLLDLGCGPASFTSRLRALVPRSTVVGLDWDARLLALARHRLDAGSDGWAPLVRGAAEAVPLRDGWAHFAVARFLFQHLPDPVRVAREARRVLAAGGTLAVIDVDAELWGLVEPGCPELGAVYARAAADQLRRGGDRLVGRRLWSILREAGFTDLTLRIYAYHSDELGVEAFAPQMDPARRLLPLLERGAISVVDYATAVEGFWRFLAAPHPFVLMLGFAVWGRNPVDDGGRECRQAVTEG
jgi:ubiquinone/menaquinone biosynthesis C-methylase UbiE